MRALRVRSLPPASMACCWEELQGSDELHTRSPKLLSGCTGRWAEDGGAVSLRPALMFKALPYAPWLLRRKKPRCSMSGLPPLMT